MLKANNIYLDTMDLQGVNNYINSCDRVKIIKQ